MIRSKPGLKLRSLSQNDLSIRAGALRTTLLGLYRCNWCYATYATVAEADTCFLEDKANYSNDYR